LAPGSSRNAAHIRHQACGEEQTQGTAQTSCEYQKSLATPTNINNIQQRQYSEQKQNRQALPEQWYASQWGRLRQIVPLEGQTRKRCYSKTIQRNNMKQLQRVFLVLFSRVCVCINNVTNGCRQIVMWRRAEWM